MKVHSDCKITGKLKMRLWRDARATRIESGDITILLMILQLRAMTILAFLHGIDALAIVQNSGSTGILPVKEVGIVGTRIASCINPGSE